MSKNYSTQGRKSGQQFDVPLEARVNRLDNEFAHFRMDVNDKISALTDALTLLTTKVDNMEQILRKLYSQSELSDRQSFSEVPRFDLKEAANAAENATGNFTPQKTSGGKKSPEEQQQKESTGEKMFRELAGKSVIDNAVDDEDAYKGGNTIARPPIAKDSSKVSNGNRRGSLDNAARETLQSMNSNPGGDDGDDGSSSSSSSYISSDNEQMKKAAKKRNKKKKRKSLSKQIIEESTARKEDFFKVMLTRTLPSFEHITLERLNIRDFFIFIHAFDRFIAKNNVDLKMVHQLSDRVIRELCAHHKDLTVKKLNKMSNEKIMALIKRHIRPDSPMEFQQTLSYYVDFKWDMHGQTPTPVTFRAFYSALLMYRDEFLRYYEVIAEGNNNNIPPCNDKKGGLVRSFIEKIPYEYGWRVLRTLKKNSFDDLDEFLEEFYQIVEEDYERGKSARAINEHFGGTEYKYKLHNNGRTFTSPKKTYSTPKKSSNRHDRRSEQKLHAMSHNSDDKRHMDMEDYYAQQDRSYYYVPSSRSPKHIEVVLDESDEDDDSDDDDDVDDEESEEDLSDEEPGEDIVAPSSEDIVAMIEAFNNINMAKDKPSNTPRGCFYKTFGLPCKQGNKCPYNHNYSSLHKCYSYYADLVTKSLYKNPQQQEALKSILRKPSGDSGAHMQGNNKK